MRKCSENRCFYLIPTCSFRIRGQKLFLIHALNTLGISVTFQIWHVEIQSEISPPVYLKIQHAKINNTPKSSSPPTYHPTSAFQPFRTRVSLSEAPLKVSVTISVTFQHFFRQVNVAMEIMRKSWQYMGDAKILN